jgi:putative NIF3 family GTP cyclohydrolase 1 type 2
VQKPVTVGDVMDLFIKEIPGSPFEKTVDTLKAGDRNQEVTGIITTMFATMDVIKKAIQLKANFIIAHEPTFYNHLDDTSWLEHDEVYKYKADLLKKNGIAVWRCHDYIHSHKPDGVRTGLVNALLWEKYVDKENPSIIHVPTMSFKEVLVHSKKKLDIATVRYEGDLLQPCSRILLLPGAAGGKTQIEFVGKLKPDVLMVGELSEWETAEYIRDARLQGRKIALIVLGHAASEEPGLQWMLAWLKPKLPGIKVDHIVSGNPLSFF